MRVKIDNIVKKTPYFDDESSRELLSHIEFE